MRLTGEGPLDLAAIRARLAGCRGRAYWRSLEELAESPDFQTLLARELPRQAAPLAGALDRREFLRLMGASLALAGVTACTRQPAERIVPYVRAPEELIPGIPLVFATALPTAGGGATGVLVESHMGRPTKIEGNPEHPASLGATDIFAQAAILTLYDPDRAQVVTSAGEIRPWSAFFDALAAALEGERAGGGAGLRLLTETVTSPTLAAQLAALRAAFPAARWHQWEPAARDGARRGARLAFGTDVDVQVRLERADVVLALDADLLGSGPAALRHTRAFTSRRRPVEAPGTMSRLYVVEPTPSITGAMADHRLPLRAAAVETLARAVARGVRGALEVPGPLGVHERWIRALVADLRAHRGASVVVAGDQQPAVVHALAHEINDALGNVGRTVVYTEPIAAEPVVAAESLAALVEAMDAEEVGVLLIVGGNPVATAPADLRFGARLAKVGFRVHLGLYEDETSLLCHWHLPETHPLEAWSDVRADDGTLTIQQPLIAPLYEGKSVHELLAACLGEPARAGYEVVRAEWKRRHRGADFERFWRRALYDGVVPGTAAAIRPVALRRDWERALARDARAADGEPPAAGDLDLVLRLDPTILDGRFANNGWLQELPKPVTRLTWDNAALVAPATAERLGLANEDVVELGYRGRSVRAPVWIVPGQAVDTVTLHLGHGRTRGGRVADGVGVDAYALGTADAPWGGPGLALAATGGRHSLACTQHHHRMEGRHLVRQASLAAYRADPHFAHELVHEPDPDVTLYPPHPYEGYAWGMAIDLGACTGCNACVIACQAENNIPVVGKAQVAMGRELHWIRIDRYFEGDLDNPTTHHQPVPCMHCENAPCEVVCPVNATVHGNEGLNEMVYNRCVGTKYCSNNCPYKVRRFNFFLYADWTTESLKLQRNPDVTVRSRGVMEKCTYCVQRINAARIQAKREDRTIRDGEVVTACQQACPAEAIVFGDLNDPTSRVARVKADPRSYALLAELNTRPRTTYLAAVRNPNPELESS